MTTKERKKRADSIREIRRMVRLLVGQHDRDKDIAERRKKRADTIREIRRIVKSLVSQDERDKSIAEHRRKTIKVVINNEKS